MRRKLKVKINVVGNIDLLFNLFRNNEMFFFLPSFLSPLHSSPAAQHRAQSMRQSGCENRFSSKTRSNLMKSFHRLRRLLLQRERERALTFRFPINKGARQKKKITWRNLASDLWMCCCHSVNFSRRNFFFPLCFRRVTLRHKSFVCFAPSGISQYLLSQCNLLSTIQFCLHAEIFNHVAKKLLFHQSNNCFSPACVALNIQVSTSSVVRSKFAVHRAELQFAKHHHRQKKIRNYPKYTQKHCRLPI